jgi:1-phosphofructokinase
MINDHWASDDREQSIIEGMQGLRSAGARDLVVSRGEEGALAALGDAWYRIKAPDMSVVEHRGAGDSMTAALAFGRCSGLDDEATLRFAAAAGALNVTRHGLASGHAGAVARLAELVVLDQFQV